jgi:DMATS type aromatic prenyltransferase
MTQGMTAGQNGAKTPSFRPAAPAAESRPSAEAPGAASPAVDALAERLARLCQSTGLDAEASKSADKIFRELVVPWSRVEAFCRRMPSGWVSEISDDNTPIEFSVTLSPAGNEVRVLFEPQGEEQTLAAHRASALSMHEELERGYGADLGRFRLVRDLFTPPDMQGAFALWSAVVFSNFKPPSFKAYFNPQAQGVGSAVALVDEGLRRLGLQHAWSYLATTLARRGPHRDELKYFALDLTASEQARVKVYVRHHEATPEDLEIAAASAPTSTRGEAEEFARAMAGGARRFRKRATFTCAAFVGGQDHRPSASTHYVPVCAYALDDAEVEQRVSSYLQAHDMDDGPYRRVLAAFANRRLDQGVGMQSWVALRRYQGVPRLTVYLGSEARCVFPVGSVPGGTHDHMRFDSAAQVLSCVAHYGLEEHPLVRRFSRLVERREIMWLLVSNASELLANTMDVSAARLQAWLGDNAAIGRSLSPEREPLRHLLSDAVEAFRDSPDPIEALAALSAASNAARGLAKLLSELLETEELSSVGFRVEAILRDGPEADARRLWELDAAGAPGLPSIVRGAFGVHQRLWAALDRIAAPEDVGVEP